MVRVHEKLKIYKSLYLNNSDDSSVKKRILKKLPLFQNMYFKLVKKRAELKFTGSFFSKSPTKKGLENESTCLDSKDFFSDTKSFNDNVSMTNSLQSLMKSMKTCNFKKERVNESFDCHNEHDFDKKLDQIKQIIIMLKNKLEC